VCDPEYPEVTIAELGILERVSSSDGGSTVRIELVPTMLGCPALDVIARDVTDAARAACAGADVSIVVTWFWPALHTRSSGSMPRRSASDRPPSPGRP